MGAHPRINHDVQALNGALVSLHVNIFLKNVYYKTKKLHSII
jgi:hypothetical protein